MENGNSGEKLKKAKAVRINVSIPFQLLKQFDEESERRGYNRSEALREAIRDQLERWTGRRL
jgi:metal-responsive CopG/Arc/MetJ family transcriptional regulator